MFKKASEVLSSFLNQEQLEKAQNYNAFFRSWRNIAGIDIASHSRIREIEKGRLLVETDHPGWAQIINMKKSTLLRKINKLYPELDIKDVRVWVVDQLSEQEKKVTEKVEVESSDLIEQNKIEDNITASEKPQRSKERKKAEEDETLQSRLDFIEKAISQRQKEEK